MYLGIDIGTSSVKTVLFDAAQRVVAQASESLTVNRPRPGWSEQDPQDWWRGARATIDTLARTHSLKGLRGIGLAGQMHGAVCLGTADEVLRPAILWNDGRSGEECAEIEADCPESRRIAGNVAMPGFTGPKLRWIAKNEPEIFGQIQMVLLPKDYVRLHLTGQHVSEMSDASGTLWLDVALRDWSDDLLAATRMTRAQMPRLVEGSAASGLLRDDLRAHWGIEGKVVVAGGAGDNAAAACGMGVTGAGSAFVSVGTSGVLFAATARLMPNVNGAVHAFCHAIPDTWHQMGVILSAADSLEWLARISGRPAPELAGALGPLTGPSEVTFLPYLSGERTPHNDPAARGVFAGLSQAHDLADLTQAVLEGVAFAFADCQRVLKDAGTDFDAVRAVGGGVRSDIWLRIIANVLDRPVHLTGDGAVGAALGAARLAICAAEDASPAEVCTAPSTVRVIEPNPDLVPRYRDAHGRYRALYPAVSEARAG